MNNVYLYYYNDYSEVVNYIKNFKIEDIFWGEYYDEYLISALESSSIKIIIYKQINIIAIQCNKYKDIKILNIINKFLKVNLLEKRFFNLLEKKKFFLNLCRIIIDIDILGNDEELVEFNGCELLNRDFIDFFGVNDVDSISKLKLYSVQPDGYKYLINFKATNKLEFSKKFNEDEINEILFKLIGMIGELIGGE